MFPIDVLTFLHQATVHPTSKPDATMQDKEKSVDVANATPEPTSAASTPKQQPPPPPPPTVSAPARVKRKVSDLVEAYTTPVLSAVRPWKYVAAIAIVLMICYTMYSQWSLHAGYLVLTGLVVFIAVMRVV